MLHNCISVLGCFELHLSVTGQRFAEWVHTEGVVFSYDWAQFSDWELERRTATITTSTTTSICSLGPVKML